MKNLWKNYNGLFILAAMIGGFCLTLAMANAAEKIEDAKAAGEAKKIEDQAKTWLQKRGQDYAKQLQQVASQRRLFEEALEEQKRSEVEIKGKMDELEAVYKQMQKDGLWIVDSKAAAK